MNNCYTYKTRQGLNITLIKKPQFHSYYVGLGVRFGGKNLHYIKNNLEYSIIPGIAHFIEHKLFIMSDGKDAMEKFAELNCKSNAHTTSDKTIYYFTTQGDYKEPLKILLDMYFNEHFTEENVESEKSIILSEYADRNDDPYTTLNNDLLDLLYPNDDFSKEILGDIDDIKSIKCSDLKQFYNEFYTPNNSELVLCGNIDESIFKVIEEELDKYNLNKNKNFVFKSFVTSLNVLPPITKNYDINLSELQIGIRIDDITNKDSIDLFRISQVLNGLFSEEESFYQELFDKHYTDDLVDFYVESLEFTTYIIISITTDKPETTANFVINKLKKLSSCDISTKSLIHGIKYEKRKYLLREDTIKSIGANYLSLKLENIDYFKERDEILNLTNESALSIIPKISNAKFTYVIGLPKNY